MGDGQYTKLDSLSITGEYTSHGVPKAKLLERKEAISVDDLASSQCYTGWKCVAEGA
jgi:hypothetical protein